MAMKEVVAENEGYAIGVNELSSDDEGVREPARLVLASVGEAKAKETPRRLV
jgi:hypothetical protein